MATQINNYNSLTGEKLQQGQSYVNAQGNTVTQGTVLTPQQLQPATAIKTVPPPVDTTSSLLGIINGNTGYADTTAQTAENQFKTTQTNQNDILIFMFGEVDCRYKIKSQMLKNNTTIEEEVLIVVNRYMDFIKNYNSRKIIIWGPHPQHTSPTHHYIDCFDSNERNTITKIFNEKLELFANKGNYSFITLFNELIDKPELNNYFLDDTIHIKPCKEILDIYINKIIKS